MSERGVVGVDRGVFEHELLKGEPYTRVQAWLWLIAEAAWKARRSRVAGMWVELERAQLAHSLGHMARTWKWTVKRVRCFLARLAKDGMVEVGQKKGTVKGTGITLITICNYDEYQIVGLPKGTGQGTAGAQQGQQPEEGKNLPTADDAAMRARAFELAEQVYDIFGFDRQFIPPNWCGLTDWLEAGLRGGWKPDLVRLAARKVAARRKQGPPNNFRYLGPAIVEEHQLAAAPPPTVKEATDGQGALTLVRSFDGRRRGGGFASIAADAAKRAASNGGSGS